MCTTERSSRQAPCILNLRRLLRVLYRRRSQTDPRLAPTAQKRMRPLGRSLQQKLGAGRSWTPCLQRQCAELTDRPEASAYGTKRMRPLGRSLQQKLGAGGSRTPCLQRQCAETVPR